MAQNVAVGSNARFKEVLSMRGHSKVRILGLMDGKWRQSSVKFFYENCNVNSALYLQQPGFLSTMS